MSTEAGVVNSGSGTVNVSGGTAIGRQVNHGPEAAGSPPPGRRADVGVLTVLTEELRAVVGVLERAGGYRTWQLYGGVQVHEATVDGEGGPVRVVAMQTLDPGPRSAALAYQALRREFNPPLVLLVGIAGGISDRVTIGDVVIADQVVYYDARREGPSGARRRGQAYLVQPVLRQRVHEYFRRYGTTVALSPTEVFGVRRGAIGSGDAVITDQDSDIRAFLAGFNEKTLAVETEAAGVAQAFLEQLADGPLAGWLTIRGISDHADDRKGHAYHDLAAAHAAEVMGRLLPLLRLAGRDG